MNVQISQDKMRLYFEAIGKAACLKKSDGILVLASYGQNPVTGKNLPPKVQHFKPDNIEDIIKTAEAWDQETHRNVYMPLALFKEDLSKGKKGGLDDIVAVFGFCADFDDKDASKYLERLPLKPDIVLETSKGRFQAIYLFDRPLSKDEAAPIAAMLKEHSQCDHGTKDVCHVWRIGGCLNWPNKKKVDEGRPQESQLVEMVQAFNGIYTSVDALKQKMEKKHPQIETKKKKAKEQPYNIKTSPWNGDFSELRVNETVKQLIMNGKPEGERSEAIWSVLCALAKSNLSNTVIQSVFQTYPIGDKSRAKHSPEKWLQPQIDKARIEVTNNSMLKTEKDWDQLVPLDAPKLSKLEANLLPGPLGDMANEVSAFTETSLELSAGLGVAAIATVCQGKFEVSPEKGYIEPTNVWVISILSPANRKSAVLKIMTKPLSSWEENKRDELKPEIIAAKTKKDNQDERVKSLRKGLANLKIKPDDKQAFQTEIEEIEANSILIPKNPRLFADDVTPEQLAVLMSENNDKLALLSSEGGIFGTMAGRYSKGVSNIDIFLKGHAGDPVRVDRSSRPPLFMDSPLLSMGLTVQPEVLTELAKQKDFRGKGLLARFLYLIPISIIGFRKLEAHPVSKKAEMAYDNMLQVLLEIDPSIDPLTGKTKPHVLSLEREALILWKDFQRKVEHNMREGEEFEHIMDFAGKLPGATLRIAGLFHCAEKLNSASTEKISSETMNKAIQFCEIITEHTIEVFNMMGMDPEVEKAKKIWRWIDRNRFKSFSRRDCFNALRGTYKRVNDMDEGFNVLEERNYIRKKEAQGTCIGRPSIQYLVNPALTDGPQS